MAFRRGRIDPKPLICQFDDPRADVLLELNDSSLVSLSSNDNTFKRWSILRDERLVQLVGTFSGHTDFVWGVVEKDDNTLVSGSSDSTLKVWNKASCECLESIQMEEEVRCIIKTNNQHHVVIGLGSGTVETRRISDFDVISSFNLHHPASVLCVCELQDGSFVTGSDQADLKRWSEDGTVLQTFIAHTDFIEQVIESRPNTIVIYQTNGVIVWDVSTGNRLHDFGLSNDNYIKTMTKLAPGLFAIAEMWSSRLQVWMEEGELVQTVDTGCRINAMTRLKDGSVVTTDGKRLEIRQL